MQSKPYELSVPVSHPLGVGQWDSNYIKRDSAETPLGTVDLKALADKVLARDTAWDSNEVKQKQSVPADNCQVGQLREEWDVGDWQESYEERCAIYEFDGGVSRDAAEEQAKIELLLLQKAEH